MDHYQRAHLPSTQEEALRWAKRDISAGFKHAALLKKLELGAEETGILHAGCTYGMFALTISRTVRSLGHNPANVVGIDNCRPLLDLARAALDIESEWAAGVHDLVGFCELDVTTIGDQASIDMIQSMFPRGISTIIVTEMFKDLGDRNVRTTMRDLMALLRPGGRLVFDTYHESLGWGAVHVITGSVVPDRLLAITNLTTPRTRGEAEEHTRTACGHISGTASSGADVDVQDTDCIWLGQVWEDFASLPVSPGGPIYAPIWVELAGNNGGSILINHEAIFNPTQRRFYKTRDFSVEYLDKSNRFFAAMTEKLVNYYQAEQHVGRLDAQNAIAQRMAQGRTLHRIEDLFRQYRADLFDESNHIEGIGLWRMAAEIFANDENARWIAGLPTVQPNYIKHSPASVLVTLRRA